MQQLFWFLRVHSGIELASPYALPIMIGFLMYQVHYAVLLLQCLVRLVKYGTKAPPVPAGARKSALLVMPTLLRNAEELAGLKAAITSVATNGYPGELVVVAAIDDGVTRADLFADLASWTAKYPAPKGVTILATCTKQRTGKAVAIDNGAHFVADLVKQGKIRAFPELFFNMDADSALGPDALVRLADRLTTKYRGTEQYPNIVTSNVSIARSEYWRGWREFFTVRGQISIGVAAEFVLSMLGKHNYKFHLVPGASGALYCTWSKLHVLAPKWAAFMQTLRWKDVAKWWLGEAPPSFETSDCGYLPEGMTGPGDDTWVTWLAYCARWESGNLTVELPRTPGHAFWYMLRGYFFRALQYEPHSVVETKTPTTIKALFKQRVRWNTSRVELSQRWGAVVPFHWTLLFPTVVSTIIIVYFNAMEAVTLLLLPFAAMKGFFVGFCCAFVVYSTMRFLATTFGIWLDGGFKKHGHKLLGLVMSVPYHFVFNKMTTFWGYTQDVFLFGVSTGFSPEETHIKGKASRIALAYRCRRFLYLAARAVTHNDVPLGFFWFGWHENEYTPSGFDGWTTGNRRVLKARTTTVTTELVASPAPALEAAAVAVAAATVQAVTAIAATVENTTVLATTVAASIAPPRLSLVPTMASMGSMRPTARTARDTMAPRSRPSRAPSLRPSMPSPSFGARDTERRAA